MLLKKLSKAAAVCAVAGMLLGLSSCDTLGNGKDGADDDNGSSESTDTRALTADDLASVNRSGVWRLTSGSVATNNYLGDYDSPITDLKSISESFVIWYCMPLSINGGDSVHRFAFDDNFCLLPGKDAETVDFGFFLEYNEMYTDFQNNPTDHGFESFLHEFRITINRDKTKIDIYDYMEANMGEGEIIKQKFMFTFELDGSKDGADDDNGSSESTDTRALTEDDLASVNQSGVWRLTSGSVVTNNYAGDYDSPITDLKSISEWFVNLYGMPLSISGGDSVDRFAFDDNFCLIPGKDAETVDFGFFLEYNEMCKDMQNNSTDHGFESFLREFRITINKDRTKIDIYDYMEAYAGENGMKQKYMFTFERQS